MKPSKCPARGKKNEQEKRKKRGGEKGKSKSQDCGLIFIIEMLVLKYNVKNIHFYRRAGCFYRDILHV